MVSTDIQREGNGPAYAIDEIVSHSKQEPARIRRCYADGSFLIRREGGRDLLAVRRQTI